MGDARGVKGFRDIQKMGLGPVVDMWTGKRAIALEVDGSVLVMDRDEWIEWVGGLMRMQKEVFPELGECFPPKPLDEN